MSESAPNRQGLAHEGPDAWPVFIGMARIAVLLTGAVGIVRFGDLIISTANTVRLGAPSSLVAFLLVLYLFTLLTNLWFLFRGRHALATGRLLVWTQILLDFSVVCVTVSFTGGTTSFFTTLLVVVILEAGVLLGMTQGFGFAVLSTAFVATQAWLYTMPGAADIGLWYNILVEGLSFVFTAFISGYWNQRIFRLQQFQREILDNMNSGFLITDRTGLVCAQNRAADSILNLEPGSAIGKRVEHIIAPGEGGECPVLTALRSQRDFTSYEFYANMPAGPSKLLGLTTSRLYDHGGRLTGIIATFTDLTEVDSMRQELRQQDRMAVVGELAAGLAHEIRNPVAAIRGAVEELRDHIGTPGMAARLAEIAVRESDHLNQIVTGFLDFARNPSLEHEVFDLRDCIEEAVANLAPLAAERGHVTIATETPDTPCPISGSMTQIRQVFLNLGKNALEAMTDGGALTIRMAAPPGSYEVHFDDDGPGLAPDKVARVFEPFYTTKERGVGMGLAVCLRIVTAHDGTIRAGSREGGGARMTVRLPAMKQGEQD